jgi:transaldolase
MLDVFGGERWSRLSALGARPQRLLWASTSTKDPAYDDLKYVTELVAPGTVNTLPLATLEAVLDHGRVSEVLDGATSDADAVVSGLAAHGIDVERVGVKALADGIGKFAASFDDARGAVEALLEVYG